MELGCYGNRAAKTPNIDRLAAAGIVFAEYFCTTATCSASRSVMFTGRHNHETGHYGHCHGYHHFTTFEDIKTAPAIFRENGYFTALVGKKHVGPQAVYPWEYEFAEGFNGNRDVQAISKKAGELFRDSQDRPFFLTIGFGDPHRDNTRKGFFNQDHPGIIRNEFEPYQLPIPSILPDLPETRLELAEYYQAVNRLDQGVGMVLEQLHQAKKTEETLIIFLSDNGIPFINSKTTMYDAGIHLPFIMKVPGRKSGIRNQNMISAVDVLPTFMDWAGIKNQLSGCRGRSLLPIAEKTAELTDWDHIFGSHTFHEITNCYPIRMLRTRKYKYSKNVLWKLDFPFAADLYASPTWEAIRLKNGKIGKRPITNYVRRPLEELYDIETDPDEVNNLAEQPEYRNILCQMRQTVDQWQEETDDPWLFRDGVSYRGVKRYIKEGLKLPDANDMLLQ
ncbi:MAG: hypothetical protein A2X48_13060 [Lentisphaerae bacterium GWF2_49_21]|nr:MAG: hypothetical protein A2X48_13060 [Lentisphaerae bacterium GWF2_49_21]